MPYQCLGTATPPTPQGGTIEDGTWVLTASAYYGATCPAPEQDRDLWLICGTNWQTAQEHTMGTGQPQVFTFDANVTPMNATTVSLQITCGANMIETVPFQFTATPSQLTLFVGSGRVDTYVKQ